MDYAAERRITTVIFCDLVGSTELAGRLDAEALRSVTLRFFEVMRERIAARGGVVEKFIGDAIMAVFGIPAVREDDALQALAAALEMLAALNELNDELEPVFGIRLRVRIGVNTGEVVAASDSAAGQALVSGEAVNVAARLEQCASPSQILLSENTLRAVGNAVSVADAGRLGLRGKADPVNAYRLLGFVVPAAYFCAYFLFAVPFFGGTWWSMTFVFGGIAEAGIAGLCVGQLFLAGFFARAAPG